MTHSLSIYRITANERRKSDNLRILSDLGGKDLLTLTDQFLKAWLSDSKEVKVANEIKRAYRISEDYAIRGRIIDGLIESGEYGQVMEVVNINDSQGKYTIKLDEVAFVPFYFMFFYPEDMTDGFLILQRIGSSGIYSMLSEEYIKYMGEELGGDDVIKISPFSIKDLLTQNMTLISKASSITVKRKDMALFSQLSKGLLDEEGVRSETKFYLPRNKYFDIGGWLQNRLDKKSGQPSAIADTTEINDADISVEVKMSNGKNRVLSLGKISNFGTNLPLKEDIKLNEKGYPELDSLREEAMQLVDHIKKIIDINED